MIDQNKKVANPYNNKRNQTEEQKKQEHHQAVLTFVMAIH